ncbi:hypothetical protein ACFQ1S_23940, partial [Kibdelosporangium lantanae]
MNQQNMLPVHMRRNFFDPVPELGKMRADQPVYPIKTPWGIDAWLVTRFTDVMTVLGDNETFDVDPVAVGLAEIVNGADSSADSPAETEQSAGSAGELTHARMRRLLLPEFSARQINKL